jgi:hypothetical protein
VTAHQTWCETTDFTANRWREEIGDCNVGSSERAPNVVTPGFARRYLNAVRQGDAEDELRKQLIEQLSDFRALMVRTLLDDSAESAEFAWTECSKPVDALMAGKAVTLHRYELPPDHSQSTAGHPSDLLVLGADDVLRPA